MRPFSELTRAALRDVPAVLSDVDGTLTTADELRASTLRALEQVHQAGVPVVLVTGRPAGYAEMMARYLPVRAVVAENGGLYFARDARSGSLRKRYAEPDPARARNRRRVEQGVAAALRAFPDARLSTDSAFTEVDLAIDYNEQARLPVETARKLERWLRARGLAAVRSSVHVNVWAGGFDKRSTSLQLLRRELGLARRAALARCLYLGDSYNDAPMFAAFERSVGVGQVRRLSEELLARPSYVTRASEGRGAEEVLRALARAR